MDRIAIVEAVKAFCEANNVSIDDIVVGYGAAAVMHGIRHTTNDIDVDVHESEFEAIQKLDGIMGKGLTGEFVSIGDIDFHVEEHTDFVLIDGIWVVGARTLLRQYRWLFNHPERMPEKRKKDLMVIKALTVPAANTALAA
jgi:hypothetical protein